MKVSIDGAPAVDVNASGEEVRQMILDAGISAMSIAAPDDSPAFMSAWDDGIAKAFSAKSATA